MYVCTACPNIAKTTQHHQLFAKIPISGTVCYIFLRKMTPKKSGHVWGQFRPLCACLQKAPDDQIFSGAPYADNAAPEKMSKKTPLGAK